MKVRSPLSMRGRRNCEACGRWRYVTDFRPVQWLWGQVIRISADCNSCYRDGTPQQDYLITPHQLRAQEKVVAPAPRRERHYTKEQDEEARDQMDQRVSMVGHRKRAKKPRPKHYKTTKPKRTHKNKYTEETYEQFRARENERKRRG